MPGGERHISLPPAVLKFPQKHRRAVPEQGAVLNVCVCVYLGGVRLSTFGDIISPTAIPPGYCSHPYLDLFFFFFFSPVHLSDGK